MPNKLSNGQLQLPFFLLRACTEFAAATSVMIFIQTNSFDPSFRVEQIDLDVILFFLD